MATLDPTQMLMGLGAGALLAVVVVYVYQAWAWMLVGQKGKAQYPWLAWIPIANLWLFADLAKKEWWWALVFLVVGFVPFLGGIAQILMLAYAFWLICENLNKPGWWGILLLIPLVNLVMLGILAWGE